MLQTGILDQFEPKILHEEFYGFVIILDYVGYCCSGMSHLVWSLTELFD